MQEPKWISEDILLALHARQIERYGGAHGIIDENVVGSALARPLNRWAYEDATDLADLAAAYLVGFARTQGFRDGNKRTALAAALVFLRLNGFSVQTSGEDLYALTLSAALGEASDGAVAERLREWMQPLV